MNHEILKSALLKGLGGSIPPAIRDRWGAFVSSKSERFVFRYEWIKDRRFWDWLYRNLDTLEIEDGEEWFGVFIWRGFEKPNLS